MAELNEHELGTYSVYSRTNNRFSYFSTLEEALAFARELVFEGGSKVVINKRVADLGPVAEVKIKTGDGDQD